MLKTEEQKAFKEWFKTTFAAGVFTDLAFSWAQAGWQAAKAHERSIMGERQAVRPSDHGSEALRLQSVVNELGSPTTVTTPESDEAAYKAFIAEHPTYIIS